MSNSTEQFIPADIFPVHNRTFELDPRISPTDNRLVRYTSPGNGKRVDMKPGRFLKKYFQLDDKKIAECVDKWRSRLVFELRFATTREDIRKAYEAIPSCMQNTVFKTDHYGNDAHAAEVYAKAPLAVAYTIKDGEITSRSVVNTKAKQIGVVYGDVGLLSASLRRAGYTDGHDSFQGCELLRLETAYGDVICPYIDVADGITLHSNKLVLDDGGHYGCRNENGLLDGQNYEDCSNCSEQEHTDNIRYIGEDYDEPLCTSCYGKRVVACESCECEIHPDDVHTVDGNKSWCYNCADNHSVICDGCNQFITDEHHVGDATYCNSCVAKKCEDCICCRETVERDESAFDCSSGILGWHCIDCATETAPYPYMSGKMGESVSKAIDGGAYLDTNNQVLTGNGRFVIRPILRSFYVCPTLPGFGRGIFPVYYSEPEDLALLDAYKGRGGFPIDAVCSYVREQVTGNAPGFNYTPGVNIDPVAFCGEQLSFDFGEPTLVDRVERLFHTEPTTNAPGPRHNTSEVNCSVVIDVRPVGSDYHRMIGKFSYRPGFWYVDKCYLSLARTPTYAFRYANQLTDILVDEVSEGIEVCPTVADYGDRRRVAIAMSTQSID